jgi:hypothetical protein
MNDREPISLTELCAQNAERIMAQLIAVLREKGGPRYKELSAEVLQRRVQRLFDSFWQGISKNDPQPMTEYIWAASRERGHEGFSVAELQAVGLYLRDVLLGIVDEVYADNQELRLQNSRRVEELIWAGIGASVQGFVDGREALITRQYQALRRDQEKKDADTQDSA